MSYWESQANRFFGNVGGAKNGISVLAQMHDSCAALAQVRCDEMFTDATMLTEIELLVTEYYRLTYPLLFWDCYNLEAEAIGQKMHYSKDNLPDIDRTDYLIKSEADLDKIKFTGLDQGRLGKLAESFRLHMKYTGFPALGQFCAPFSLACNIYGFDNLIYATADNPGFVQELFRRIVDDLILPLMKAMRAEVPELPGAYFADAWCSPPVVTEQLVRDTVLPHYMRAKELLEQEGFPIGIIGQWGESMVPQPESFVALKAEMNAGMPFVICGLDPDVETLGLSFYRAQLEQFGVNGLLGFAAETLRDGSKEDIEEKLRRFIGEGCKDGNACLFINMIHKATPPQNVHDFMQIIDALGQYPLDEKAFSKPVETKQRETFEEFIREKVKTNEEGYTFAWLEKSGLRT